MSECPLHRVWPKLRSPVPLLSLGDFPTPVQSLDVLAERLGRPGASLWVKRDDISSERYGGNKVRTLEVLLAEAQAKGATHIYSTGAYGSNHSVATVAHAPVAGLAAGVIAFPQPREPPALENLRALLSYEPQVVALAHWSVLPFGMAVVTRRLRREGKRGVLMPPGGATPVGALGYVSAALELAEQVAAAELPPPGEIVLAVGSTCTTAGLLVGLHHAARLGLGFEKAPLVRAVRVTPWPVTSAWRVVGLAQRTSALLAQLTGDPSLELSKSELQAGLAIVPGYLGCGYGWPTPKGKGAIRDFELSGGPGLDSCYSGKAAAHLVDRVRTGLEHPILFWATKSSAPLPTPSSEQLAAAPRAMRRWLRKVAG